MSETLIGRMVVVRHATSTDLAIVEGYLKGSGEVAELADADVVVAAEERRIIGFGILKREYGAGCISLFEDSGRKGIGSSILRHIMEHTPRERVYASRFVSYFTGAGLAKTRSSAKNADSCRSILRTRWSLAAAAR